MNPNLSAMPTPSGRSLGQFFADEVAKPLGLDFYIGLPASVDRDRVAHLHGYSRAKLLLHLNTMPPRFVAAMLNPRSLTARTFGNPKDIGDLDAYNRDDVRAVEIPAANGIGTARSVAKAYGCVATGGSDLGLTASTLDALAQPAIPPTNGSRDKVLHIDTTFSLGYLKPFPKLRFGSSDKAFGTPGAGGSSRWVRRSRYRYRVRLRDEQSRLPPLQRSKGTRSSPGPLP